MYLSSIDLLFQYFKNSWIILHTLFRDLLFPRRSDMYVINFTNTFPCYGVRVLYLITIKMMAIWGGPNFCCCKHCCDEHYHMCICIYKCTGALSNMIKTNFMGLLWVEHGAKVFICVTHLILTITL